MFLTHLGGGDFITDYEGISGYEAFRGDLAMMYLVGLDGTNGKLLAPQVIPMQMRRFRLEIGSAYISHRALITGTIVCVTPSVALLELS